MRELFRVVGEHLIWSFREEGELYVFHSKSSEEAVNYSKRWRRHNGRLQFYNTIRETGNEHWKDFSDEFNVAYEQHLSRTILE